MWNPFSLFKTNTDKLLNTSDKQMLVQAIQAAEKQPAEKFVCMWKAGLKKAMHLQGPQKYFSNKR